MSEATGNKLQFQAGDIVCMEGEKLKNIFIIESGDIGIFSKEKDHLYLRDVKKVQDIVGDDVLFTEKRIAPIAIALTDVTVACIKIDEIDYILDKCPDWLGNVLGLITDRLKASRAALQEHKITSEYIENYQLSADQLHAFSESIKERE